MSNDLSRYARRHFPWVQMSMGVWPAVLWVGTASAAWLALLVIEYLQREPSGGALLGVIGFLSETAFIFSLFASAPLALVHILVITLELRSRDGFLISTLVVGILAAYPAWHQASFLTAGDRVSGYSWVELLRICFFVAVVIGCQLLWLWHLAGVRQNPISPSRPLRRVVSLLQLATPGILSVLWSGIGLIALGALFFLISFHLKFYAYFAAFLLAPTWLIASSLLFRLARRRVRITWPPMVWLSSFIIIALAVVYVERTRDSIQHATLLSQAQLLSLTDVLISRRETPIARVDVSQPGRFKCREERTALIDSPLPMPETARKNVIMISIDALRPDAIQWRVDGKPIAPELQKFAASSMQFTRAVTTYPATLFAVGGALTGLSSSQLLLAPRVPDNIFTTTRPRFDVQFISLPSVSWFRMPIVDTLFVQGVPVMRQINADQQTTWFIQRLHNARIAKERTFAWIHYYEPHHPYNSHRNLYFGADDLARYKSEVAYVDKQFGRLVNYLEANKWFEDSLVLIFSDHGQALGERGSWGHHVYLNSWISDILLLMRAPEVVPGKSDALVDPTDVAATVLHYTGVPSLIDLEGRSLLSYPDHDDDRFRVSEAFPIRGRNLFDVAHVPIVNLEKLLMRVTRVQNSAKNYEPKVSIVQGSYRMIINRATGLEELYDRNADPTETHDLTAEEPEVVDKLRERLRAWHATQSESIYCRILNAIK